MDHVVQPGDAPRAANRRTRRTGSWPTLFRWPLGLIFAFCLYLAVLENRVDAAQDVVPSRIVVRLSPRAVRIKATESTAPPPSARFVDQDAMARKTCSCCKGKAPQTAFRMHNGIAVPEGVTDEFGSMCSDWGIDRVSRIYRHKFLNPQSAARNGLDRTFVLEVPPGTDAAAVAADFRALSVDVEFATVEATGAVAGVFPNDPSFPSQYNMHNTGQTGGVIDADIDALEAWEVYTGEFEPVTIAIIDTGVSPHEDFGGRLAEGINTVGSGEFTTDTTDTCQVLLGTVGHGTHVAGIAAAEGNNGIGVAGVTWGATILPVKVFGGCGGGESDVAEGIIWATDHGADVCNISLQFCSFHLGAKGLLESAVDYAYDNGVLVVSAAGNSNFNCGESGVLFPAKFVNSMAISATNDEDHLSSISRFGDEVDVSAPGESILSTVAFPNDNYAFLSGTSMATPHVSGLAALLKSFAPNLTNVELRDIITLTADDLGSPGWDEQFGYGRINAYEGLLESGGPRILNSDPPDGAIDARQPTQPDGSPTEPGPNGAWQWVDLTFPGNTAGLTTIDFTVQEDPPSGDSLFILAIVPKESICRVVLNRTITPGAWTTITHVESATFVRVGFLPGDSDGDGSTTLDDLLVASGALAGTIGPLPLWSVDLNRSGVPSPQDLLRGADLLGGAAAFDAYLGQSLPP